MGIQKSSAVLVLTLSLAAGACFPGGENSSDLSVQLSLEDLGFENYRSPLLDWKDWYDNGQPRSLVFDLGQAGRGFYLGLQLSGKTGDGQLAFTGNRVEIAEDLLTVDLSVGECTECFFTATIFWEESATAATVSTFSGSSPTFDVLPGAVPDYVDLDVYLSPTGTIRCLPENPDFSGEVTLAAMDVRESVIFPAVGGTLDQQGLVLPAIPIGREMNILVWSQAAGAYEPDPLYQAVTLDEPGQEREIQIGL